MKKVILIFGDQLSLDITSLQGIDQKNDLVLMIEAADEFSLPRHHKQKIALIVSAMRHFADLLRQKGFNVEYLHLNDQNNSGIFSEELYKAVKLHQVEQLILTEPSEFRMWEMTQKWKADLKIPIEIREDERYICSKTDFATWAAGRKTLRMEHFYHQMRHLTGYLMEDDKPEGGSWNYDAQNRKTALSDIARPEQLSFNPDQITTNVITLVEKFFKNHFGTLEHFNWAVDRNGALLALEHFIMKRLPLFGDYQDLMRSGDETLFHSLISPYLNLGLLQPDEVCEVALQAYEAGLAPLNCVEGFIRQIIGWREYVRGVYWLKMPAYKDSNFLDAQRALPNFFWTGKTELNCLAEVISGTAKNAYAHHIQRLMITGNFALLAGIKPAEVEEWYLIVYADAFEWVELPNTHGMVLYADGGLLASKPYAASAAYINRMSDYCKSCQYKPREKTGPGACPFNYLYWDFLLGNEHKLKANPRMGLVYKMLKRMTEKEQARIRRDAETFLESLSKSKQY